jgi:phosphatidate cytidylyltransferase
MSESDLFFRTLWSVSGLFGTGAILILVLGRFDIKRIVEGELGARFIGWLILTPVYMLVLFSNIFIGASILLIGLFLVIIEYSQAARLDRSQQLFLYILAGITLLVVLLKPDLFAALPAFVLFLLTLIPIVQNRPYQLQEKLGLVPWGYMYTVWTLAHGILMLSHPNGTGILLVIIVGCALADIGAYVVGRAIGRTVIAPEIHASKAWEGILGNLLGAGIAVTVFQYIIPFYDVPTLLGLTLIIGIGSSWGDILSSMVKRNARIKDWGSLIPGHGGVLDRLNSLLVVMPLVYYFLIIILPSNQQGILAFVMNN